MSHKVLDWLAWYPLDFWGSLRVLRLSEAACNLYRWMLDYQWTHGGVPDDLILIQRLYPWGESASNSWNSVRPLFEVTPEGQLVNARMAELYASAAGLVERRSAGGKRSAQSRRAKYGSAAPGAAKATDAKSVRKSVQKTTGTSERIGTERREEKKTEENPQKRASRAPAPPAWVAPLAEIVSVADAYAWGEACDEWATARRENKHKALGATGWRAVLRQWYPMGLTAFQEALRYSAASGWQSINGKPANGQAPTGIIQRGPSAGQLDARAVLFNRQPSPEPARETTARVIDP